MPDALLRRGNSQCTSGKEVAGRLNEVETPGPFSPEQPLLKQNLGHSIVASQLIAWSASV
jgi:hypothetical protein